MKYLIVGGSIAAYTAYKEIKKIDNSADVKVVSKESVQPYSKMLLPYLISHRDVKNNMFFEIGSDDIILDDAVVSVDTDGKIVKTEHNREFQYDKLMIATGADAYIPKYEGSYKKNSIVGVRYLNDMENIENITASCKSGHIILLGAGLVTLETGWALVKKGFSVSYIVRSNRILSQILDKDSADMVEGYIEKNYPVKFIKENDVEFIDEKNNGVYVKLTSGDSIEGCMVVVGKGVRPNVDFLSNTDIEAENGIGVDEYLRTNNKDIYAVGDVAAFNDVVDNKKKIHAIWPVAVAQAKAAAKNMLGIKSYYMPEFSRNILPVFDLNIFSGGAANKDENDIFKIKNSLEYRKIVLKNGVLKGFILIGEISNYGAYIDLSKRSVDVAQNVDRLLYGSLNINYDKLFK